MSKIDSLSAARGDVSGSIFNFQFSTVAKPLQDFPNPCISWGQPTTEKS
jgi:hypothetical protein